MYPYHAYLYLLSPEDRAEVARIHRKVMVPLALAFGVVAGAVLLLNGGENKAEAAPSFSEQARSIEQKAQATVQCYSAPPQVRGFLNCN